VCEVPAELCLQTLCLCATVLCGVGTCATRPLSFNAEMLVSVVGLLLVVCCCLRLQSATCAPVDTRSMMFLADCLRILALLSLSLCSCHSWILREELEDTLRGLAAFLLPVCFTLCCLRFHVCMRDKERERERERECF